MQFVYNDGGRAEAGYKGKTGDCVCRAISIALKLPYQQVYNELKSFISSHRNCKSKKNSNVTTGITQKFCKKYLESKGWRWVPCMKIGTGCKVHLREEELPKGRLIVSASRHLTAIIDGVIHDTYDCSRDGSRCVYGYFTNV